MLSAVVADPPREQREGDDRFAVADIDEPLLAQHAEGAGLRIDRVAAGEGAHDVPLTWVEGVPQVCEQGALGDLYHAVESALDGVGGDAYVYIAGITDTGLDDEQRLIYRRTLSTNCLAAQVALTRSHAPRSLGGAVTPVRAIASMPLALVLACSGRPLDTDGDETTTASTSATTTSATTGTATGDPQTPTTGATIAADLGGSDLACDVWHQDCPEGQKCIPWPLTGDDAFSEARCVPLAAELSEFSCLDAMADLAPPGAIDNCEEGALCWKLDNLNIIPNACVPQCTGSPDDPQCPPDMSCHVRDDQLALCEALRCEPERNPQCLEGRVCGFDGEGDFQCFPAHSGPNPWPAVCAGPSDCTVGALCAPAELAPADCPLPGMHCCLQVCSVMFDDCNVLEMICVPFFPEGTAPAGHEDVGVCVFK